MGCIAIVGAGALGGAVAHTLARRNRVPEVRLIDPEQRIAAGKALDITQSSPVEGFTTRVTAAGPIVSAAGADVVVLADAASTDREHGGEAGLALVRQLVQAGHTSPIVFAGASQRELLGAAVTELRQPRARVLGSAPFALESAVRAMTALLLDRSGADVSLRVLGVPPRAAVVAWEEATASGLPLSTQLPAHEIAALTARIPGLWPPGPYALGSAAARVVEALVHGSRRLYTCFVALDRGGVCERVVAMPVELMGGRIARIVEPALTRQEQTRLDNAMAD